MGTGERKSPEDIHAECRERIAKLEARLEVLERENRELKARLDQNSRNSDRPPSSDLPWAPRPGKPPTGRKPGGQPGHEGHQREFLPLAKVDRVEEVKPRTCGKCGRRLKGKDSAPVRHQVTEIPQPVPVTTEYRLHALVCRCGHRTLGELPAGTPPGSFGPRVEAILAYLTGKAHLSKRQIQDALEDLFGVLISLGSIKAAEERVSQAVGERVQEAKEYVQRQRVVHADETGWPQGRRPEGGRRRLAWLWVAATQWVSVFLIHVRRGAEGARALLGEFGGYLVTDRWNGYNGWPLGRRQLCWAHLIRDFRGFLERGKKSAPVGEALLFEAERMFELWHRVRDGTLARTTFRTYMRPIRRKVERLLRRGMRCGEKKTQGKCRRILAFAPAMWTFVRVPGLEPTNNTAERAVRPAVLYRKGCFGTQSPKGSRFVERILTVVTTLRQQGRDVLDYLTVACRAAQHGRSAPSLLPRRLHIAA